jgi:ElaB/YqjD/DUF883 family membrane-anchored ribosome-binding protein
VLGGGTVFAQSKKTAKEAENLEKSGEDAKEAVEEVVEHIAKMLEGYNAIIDGSAKNPQSSYKKLNGDLKGTEKLIGDADKKLAAMNKNAEKFFAAWEADLASFSSEDMKAKSQKRLDAGRERYASLGEVLGQAGAAFDPLVKNLTDQILYLGRDLSPEAIADLQDEAASLNEMADEVSTKVKQLLDDAGDPESPMEEDA